MELNQEDNGNRQFIMVQFPESTPEKSVARKAGFENIAEIGKERIRRVCQKSRSDRPVFASLNSHHPITKQKIFPKQMTRRLFSVS